MRHLERHRTARINGLRADAGRRVAGDFLVRARNGHHGGCGFALRRDTLIEPRMTATVASPLGATHLAGLGRGVGLRAGLAMVGYATCERKLSE